jgi:hypothetical protein
MTCRRPGPLAVGVGVVLALVAGGVAAAVVSTISTGAGSATVRSLTLNVDAPPVTGVSPSRPATVHLLVHNPAAAFGLKVLGIETTSVDTDRTGCPADNVSIRGFDPALPTALGAPGADRAISLTIELAPGAPNDCQGAVFTFHLLVNGRIG